MLENKKKIYIIGTVGVPACYGGFESLVDNLLDYTPADVEYTVLALQRNTRKSLNPTRARISFTLNGMRTARTVFFMIMNQ